MGLIFTHTKVGSVIMTKLLLGADPEIFIKINGLNVSAHGLLAGTKEKPQKVSRGAVQIDGTTPRSGFLPKRNRCGF